MNKLFKIISVSILGLLLTTGVFAKTEVVYIPKNTGNPYFDSIIKGRAYLHIKNVPVKFTSRIFCQSFSSTSLEWSNLKIPATLTSVWSVLNLDLTSSKILATSFTLDISKV